MTGYCLELLPIHIKTKKTIEERNLDHLPIPKEEMKSIFENKFKREIVKLVVGHEHCKEDGYYHYQCYVKLIRDILTETISPILSTGNITYQRGI